MKWPDFATYLPNGRDNLLRMPRVTVVQFVSIVVFACGSTMLNAASRRACDLLNSQMATALAGGTVDAPMDAGFLCVYADESAKTQVMLSVTDASAQDAESYIQAHGGAKQGDTYESIPSLPSKNLLVVTTYQKHSLTVFVRGKEVNLIVHRPMTPELKTAMLQVMKDILARF